MSTTIGCEGLAVRHGESILTADTPDEFAAAIARLFENPELARHLAAAGRALVEREYCWERIGRQLEQAYAQALGAGAGQSTAQTRSSA